jgi:hypothetical protein
MAAASGLILRMTDLTAATVWVVGGTDPKEVMDHDPEFWSKPFE